MGRPPVRAVPAAPRNFGPMSGPLWAPEAPRSWYPAAAGRGTFHMVRLARPPFKNGKTAIHRRCSRSR